MPRTDHASLTVKVDVITQEELKRLMTLYNLHGEMVLDIRRRIEAGAEIAGAGIGEDGDFWATSDGPVTEQEDEENGHSSAFYREGLNVKDSSEQAPKLDYESEQALAALAGMMLRGYGDDFREEVLKDIRNLTSKIVSGGLQRRPEKPAGEPAAK
jgi:hypothetical protein